MFEDWLVTTTELAWIVATLWFFAMVLLIVCGSDTDKKLDKIIELLKKEKP